MRAAAVALLLLAQGAAAAETRLSVPPLDLRAEAAGDRWRIRVLDARGAEVQRIEVETDAPGQPPLLADADGDGAPDLWVATGAGNANLAYEVWRMLPTAGRFEQAGEIGGIAFARDAGRLVAVGRNGCCAVEYRFLAFGAGMVDQFTISRRFDPALPPAAACTSGPEDADVPRELMSRYCALGPDSSLPGTRLRVP